MNTLRMYGALIALSSIAASGAFADTDHTGDQLTLGNVWTSARPDGHAPIGVMGDHIHEAGEWMLSYRYMRMRMDGNRDGTSSVSTAEVLADPQFMIAPTEMDMEMHMFGVMRAFTDDFTFMAMVPYIRNEMDHVTMNGMKFTTNSEGIGDLRFTGLYKLHSWKRQQLHLNAGISLPTGSIDVKDTTPMGRIVLPYPMQLGSGTFDLHPGITYLGQTDNWSWGGQAMASLRLGENEENYSLGERIEGNVWGARKWNDWLSTSLRVTGQTWGDIDGRDPRTAGAPVPTADPHLRSGRRVDTSLGVNLYIRDGFLKGHRIALEYALPVYQDLDGPQLEVDDAITVGWQYAFKAGRRNKN